MTLPSLIGPADLDTLCAIAAAAPPGDFVEVGVYKGGSAARLYTIAQQQGRTLHLFDTFAGHPTTTEYDDIEAHPQGRFADAITPAELQALLPKAIIYVGEFPHTLPSDLSNIAFVHADADLYAPTKAVCTLMPERMVSGGMLYFDDFGYHECPGVERAIIEEFGNAYIQRNGKSLITLP